MDLDNLPKEIPPALLPLALEYISLNKTLGAIFIGGFAHAVLYGILCLQCFIFFTIFNKDAKLLKLSVAILCLLITNFGTLKLTVPWSIGVGIVITVLTDTLVRCWFTYRILILGKNWIVVGVLTVLVTLATMSGLWLGVEAFISPSLEAFSSIGWLFYFNFALCASSDLYISLSLCFYLYRRRSPLHVKTNSIINFLMVYAINTGLFTTMVTLASMITHGTMSDNYIFFGIYFALGPLYVNALLGSLNARDWFRHDTGAHTISVPISAFNAAAVPTNSQEGSAVYGNIVDTGEPKNELDMRLCGAEEGKGSIADGSR